MAWEAQSYSENGQPITYPILSGFVLYTFSVRLSYKALCSPDSVGVFIGETSMSKRYYWLKLNQNFFDSSEIKVLQRMENGSDYIILWQKLLLTSLNFTTETKKIGLLAFKENIPWDIDLMISVFGFSKEIINGAMKTFQKLDMITITESGEMWANDIQELIGSESDSAERVRRHRKKISQLNSKALQCNIDVTKSNTEKEIELEKEKESKKDIVAKQVLEYFNKVTKKSIRKIHKYINGRLNEGFTLEDAKQVIKYKYMKWNNDNNMKQYIRISTLFAPNHFEEYLSEAHEGLECLQKEEYEKYKQDIWETYRDTGAKQKIISFQEWCNGESEISGIPTYS